MADDLRTAAELLIINDQNLADIEVSDLLDEAPVLAMLAADEASNGTVHKYTKQTGAPVVGYRDANAGRAHDVSDDTLVTISLAIMDASNHVDKAIANAWKHGPEAYLDRQNLRHLRASFSYAEKQIFQGTGLDSDGPDGFPDAAGLDALADGMVLGAGGSTACTSVYAIRTTPDFTNCTFIMGNEGKIDWGESFEFFAEDASGNKFPAYGTPITGWHGLQIGSAYSVARLANLDAGSNTLTDTLMGQLYDLFPAHKGPTMFAMTRRSRGQLRSSRITDLNTHPQTPTEWEGIPIVVTDSISNAETAVT